MAATKDKPAPPVKARAKAADRRNTLVNIDSIKFPGNVNPSKVDGETHYYLTCVTRGIQKDLRCTKAVWTKVRSEGIHRKVTKTFTLTIEEGLVTDVVVKEAASSSVFKVEEEAQDEVKSAAADGLLVIQIAAGGEAVPKARPTRCTNEMVEEILQAIEDEPDVRYGNLICERYTVRKVVDGAEGKLIYIDVTK